MAELAEQAVWSAAYSWAADRGGAVWLLLPGRLEECGRALNCSYASGVLGCMLFTRSLTDMTTSHGSFINTWSYFVYEAVTLERRKDASAWLNHVFGSAVQNSGSLTATALTVTAGGAGVGCCGKFASAALTASWMCCCTAFSNSSCCSGVMVAWLGALENNNK